MTPESKEELGQYLARKQQRRAEVIAELSGLPARQQALQQELAALDVEMGTVSQLLLASDPAEGKSS